MSLDHNSIFIFLNFHQICQPPPWVFRQYWANSREAGPGGNWRGTRKTNELIWQGGGLGILGSFLLTFLLILRAFLRAILLILGGLKMG